MFIKIKVLRLHSTDCKSCVKLFKDTTKCLQPVLKNKTSITLNSITLHHILNPYT